MKRREVPGDAARREVLEEIGVEIELLGEPTAVVESRAQRVDLIYRARLASADGAAPHPRSPEIVDARWFPRDALPELQPETASALVALARASRTPQAPPLVPPPSLATVARPGVRPSRTESDPADNGGR